MYKIETFIPKGSLQDIRKALLEVDAGHIGNIGDVCLISLLRESGFQKKDPILL